jgi:hypothetical protein
VAAGGCGAPALEKGRVDALSITEINKKETNVDLG